MAINAQYLKTKHEAGLDYAAYMATDPAKAENWQKIYDQAALSPEQTTLIGGFKRTIRAVCISGIWCGDCVQQGPLIQRIAEANPCIDLRWLDRDEHMDLTEQVKINAGLRVPVLLLAAEDYEPVAVVGDRTLSRYRSMAARQLGGACPLPGAPVDDGEVQQTLQEWLDEFERVHLLLRLSGRLRQIHGD